MTTTTTKMASRKELMALCRRRFIDVDVSGSTFRLQSLTEAEKARYEKSVMSRKGIIREDARRRLLVEVLVDDEDKPMLTVADLDALGELDGAVLSTLFDAAMSHVGFDTQDIDSLVGN